METTTKTHWKKLTNPNYIGSYSIDEGTELTVTIEKVIREMVTGADGKKEECTVAYLKGQKPFILNSTNQKMITQIHATPYVEEWIGKSITLYVAKIKAFGDMVDALRVKPIKPATPKLPELTPLHPRWEGARKALADESTNLEKVRESFLLSKENETLLLAK